MHSAHNPYDGAVKRVMKAIQVCDKLYRYKQNASHHFGEFLPRLWCLLNEPGLAPVIAWADDGLTFNLLDKDAFEKHVLPHVYKATQLLSFYRQLRVYGFRRLNPLQDEVTTFAHREFTRNTSINMLYNVKRLDFLARNSRSSGAERLSPTSEIEDVEATAPPHLPYMAAPSATTFISRVSIGGYHVPHQPVALPPPITTLPIVVHAPTPTRNNVAQSPRSTER